jgi:hypothetical protein
MLPQLLPRLPQGSNPDPILARRKAVSILPAGIEIEGDADHRMPKALLCNLGPQVGKQKLRRVTVQRS